MKNSKKIIALLLAVVTIFSTVSFSASAAGSWYWNYDEMPQNIGGSLYEVVNSIVYTVGHLSALSVLVKALPAYLRAPIGRKSMISDIANSRANNARDFIFGIAEGFATALEYDWGSLIH